MTSTGIFEDRKVGQAQLVVVIQQDTLPNLNLAGQLHRRATEIMATKRRKNKVKEENDRKMTAALGLSALSNQSLAEAMPILSQSLRSKPQIIIKSTDIEHEQVCNPNETRLSKSIQYSCSEGANSRLDTSKKVKGKAGKKGEKGISCLKYKTDSASMDDDETQVRMENGNNVITNEYLKPIHVQTPAEDCSSNSSSVSEKPDGVSHVSSSGYSSRSESSDLDSPVGDRARSSLPPKKRRSARQKMPEQGEPISKTKPRAVSETASSSLRTVSKMKPSAAAAAETASPKSGDGVDSCQEHRNERENNSPDMSSTKDPSPGKTSSTSAAAASMTINPQRSLMLLRECQMAIKPDEEGDLPLHIAVVQDRPDVVQKVIPLMKIAGMSVDYHNRLRQTALHLAVITDLPHMMAYLMQHGASPSLPDRLGNTCLHLTTLHNSKHCLEVMLKAKQPPNLSVKNYEGLTALHIATQEGQCDQVLMLIEAGADIDSQDGKSGRTPLHHAVEANHHELVALLLAKGANVNQQSYSGSTALHVASGRSYLDIVGLLVQFGADTTIKNVYMEPADLQTSTRKSSANSLPSSPTSSALPPNKQRPQKSKRNGGGKDAKSSKFKVKQEKMSR